MSTQRPTIFIGSSVEGLEIAEAIQLNLDHKCQVTIWSQGVFGLSHGTLESLVENLNRYDFAVLVLTSDDLSISREQVKQSPRDNVLLEMGMFIGAIGRRRTFIVYDRTVDMKLPTDLAGVTPATYAPHDDGNLQASLGSVCTQIKHAINDIGSRTKSELTSVIELGESFLIMADLLGNPVNQFMIQMFETGARFIRKERHLIPFTEGYEWAKKCGGGGIGGLDFDKLCKQIPDADIFQQSLKGELTLTERGKEYAAWLIKNGRKADYFRSRFGSWGNRPDWMSDDLSKHFFDNQNAPLNG